MRVPRTFVFADLSGFTNYTAEHGDDAAAYVLSRFRAVVREVASDRGVRVAKWLGDGCMIVAIDQSDGVTAALELDEQARRECAPLALRVGIASGYALLFEGDDYVGRPVNLAARLCDAAGPGEALCLGMDDSIPDWIEISGRVTVRAMGIGDLPDVSQLRVSDDAWAIGSPVEHHPSVPEVADDAELAE